MWVLSRSSRERPENVVGTSRVNLPGTSLEGQIRTSPGRHFRMSPGRQIGTSPGRQIGTSPEWSNWTFRGRTGDVGVGRPRDVLGTNICRLGKCISSLTRDLQLLKSSLTIDLLYKHLLQITQMKYGPSFTNFLKRVTCFKFSELAKLSSLNILS